VEPNNPERLNKFLALHLGLSRRQADEAIEQGRITVNNKVASLGGRVQPADVIAIDGKALEVRQPHRYLLLNKPVGYVCSRRAQGSTPTIYSLLPEEFHALKPVGRLDKDSSGLLLLSNDGDFAFTMTHPKFHKVKIYKLRLNQELEPLHQQMINDFGIQLDDGRSQLQLARLSDGNRKEWQVTMSEGRNRQIRRTFASLGYEVQKLHRIQLGAFTLPQSLKPGSYNEIKP
jgi:23S rRNA pseudouridine2605 synthase